MHSSLDLADHSPISWKGRRLRAVLYPGIGFIIESQDVFRRLIARSITQLPAGFQVYRAICSAFIRNPRSAPIPAQQLAHATQHAACSLFPRRYCCDRPVRNPKPGTFPRVVIFTWATTSVKRQASSLPLAPIDTSGYTPRCKPPTSSHLGTPSFTTLPLAFDYYSTSFSSIILLLESSLISVACIRPTPLVSSSPPPGIPAPSRSTQAGR